MNIRYLDIDDLIILRHFHQGIVNVSKVGRLVGLSQPALSQRLRKLEGAFGEKIVEPFGRGIKLTEFGERLSKRAADVINLLQQDI